ncbi:uncharacterized protein K460DRAFT_291548 [Cucurbitaria berberidis CBS 394.84]|uniref:Uncharacterized protein n=1 Tax=Cucurbitaria berberidis CBS 394.84 TaxID=1168544 RepID=A0A9P4GBD9_9PLEO|nr:uncharacterized protein K460DRAFT_291548 [Cucurbitaria berberidis CBS 394.84]KAF1842154.1 hypothetical protein K460DRAFT_291548 [Cucurbitaria berberidis CBS 394.84]
MDFQDVEAAALPLDFDVSFIPSGSSANILDFDFSSGISSLGSLATMLDTSQSEEDQMALERALYRVAKPFSPAHIAPFARSRIEYSIEQLKAVPKMMIEHNGTPWAHSRLYEEDMPRSLQDAHAACALYIAKNEANAEHVTRFITNRVEELITTALPDAPVELLARAQALMLYQIMLVFGGDVRCYAHAEALIPHLGEAGNALLVTAAQQTDITGSLPLYPSTAARAAWRSYVFRESLRRTLLSLFQMTAMCDLLRGQLKSCVHSLLYGNRVTLSAHLWHAKNSFDFAVAWNDKKHFLVKELDFTEVLRDAQPDDVDIFARMMMVGLQGIDDIRGWFYTRGGTL